MNTPIRIAMLGMIPGNGHPYSWSAIINGYNPEEMAECPYPVIPVYLGAQRHEDVRISGAKVTHIWTDDPTDAERVAVACRIPHIAAKPEDVIGAVDAVIISTDDGDSHVRRARPFIESGLPVFIDKPLATVQAELDQFIAWKKNGARLLSSSGMRYAPEIAPLIGGQWKWITAFTIKAWENYGIHALEPVFKILGPGFRSIRAEGEPGAELFTLTHGSGTRVTISVFQPAGGSFGVIHCYGESQHHSIHMRDAYNSFRSQLVSVSEWFRTGIDPYPFEETVEMMRILIAGIRSREEGTTISI